METHTKSIGRASKELRGMRRLAARLLEVRDHERKHLANELQSNLAQNLAAVGLSLGSASDLIVAPGIEMKRHLDFGHALLRQCSVDVQTLAGILHPPVLDAFGLTAAIDWHVRNFSELEGIEVSLDIQPELGRLPDEHELCLFRVMEEALTNVYHHSGSKTASVRVYHDASEVVLEVSDAGRGMSLRKGRATGHGPKGSGILGMGERMRVLAGRLEIASGRGGTKVVAILPFVPRPSPSFSDTVDEDLPANSSGEHFYPGPGPIN